MALKLALHPRDERFTREAELLSRIRHPSVPRLVDHGEWQNPVGTPFPYLVMEWVEGLSLYDWAYEHRPNSRQVLQALAHLARALEATHSAGGVHRDVKGANVLVSEVDGRVFLTDFGSGHYLGAATLTREAFPPGTPAYRAPEAWRFVQDPVRGSAVPYAPGPADDVFALGVTAYRLVADAYPSERERDGGRIHPCDLASSGPQSLRGLNRHCCMELSALVSRMMSLRPELRGSARELAEVMEGAAREAGPEADVPLFGQEESQPVGASASSRPVSSRTRGESRRHWLSAVGVGVPLALGIGWMLRVQPGNEPAKAQAFVRVDAKDGGSVAVGDSVLTVPSSSAEVPFAWSTIALDIPPKPFPGQMQPDANGRCPRKGQVAIHGGCWLKLALAPNDCDGNGYVHKDGCYVPVFPPARPSTSGPAD